MDTSKLTQGQIIAAVGGALLVIAQFLSWADAAGPLGGSASAFDAFSIMDIIMLLVGIAAIGWAVAAAMDASARLPGNTPAILLLLAVLVGGWALGWDLENGTAGIGAWLGLIGALAIGAGAYEAGSGIGGLAGPRAPRAATGPGTRSAPDSPPVSTPASPTVSTPASRTSEPPPSSPPPGT
jgi:hypothetical protein